MKWIQCKWEPIVTDWVWHAYLMAENKIEMKSYFVCSLFMFDKIGLCLSTVFWCCHLNGWVLMYTGNGRCPHNANVIMCIVLWSFNQILWFWYVCSSRWHSRFRFFSYPEFMWAPSFRSLFGSEQTIHSVLFLKQTECYEYIYMTKWTHCVRCWCKSCIRFMHFL